MAEGDFEIDLSQFLDLFLEEGRRHIQTINTGILALEQNPGDVESLEGVFRAAHTLKGMSATTIARRDARATAAVSINISSMLTGRVES